MKIYRVINNNTSDNQNNNILLKFIASPNLYNSYEIFDSCLVYNEEDEDYYSYSEVGYNTLEHSVDRLRDYITRLEDRDRMNGSDTNRSYIEQASEIVNVLEKEIAEAREADNGYYYMFIV